MTAIDSRQRRLAMALLLRPSQESPTEYAPVNLRWEKVSVVTVFGGSGFLGRHAVEAPARDGWRICVAVRRPQLAGYLLSLGEVGQIFPIQANVRVPVSVQRAVRRAETVVNLVGVLAPSGRQTFEALDVAGARNIAKGAREAGAKSPVHVSAIAANARSPSRYARRRRRFASPVAPRSMAAGLRFRRAS